MEENLQNTLQNNDKCWGQKNLFRNIKHISVFLKVCERPCNLQNFNFQSFINSSRNRDVKMAKILIRDKNCCSGKSYFVKSLVLGD